MIPYYITSALTCLTCISLGVFVFYKNPKNPLHIAILRLNACVALWSSLLFSHYMAKDAGWAMFTLRLLHCAVSFIPACYISFVTTLLSLQKKRLLNTVYAMGAAFAFLSFSRYFISGVGPKLGFSFYADAGELYILWICYYLLFSGYGIYLMQKNMRTATPKRRNQIRYIMAASLISFSGGLTIYPLFYNIPIPPVGEHLIFLYPFIFAIAVLKHNLLDLNIVIKNAFIYSLSILLITIAYIIMILMAERFLKNMFGYTSIWSTVAAAVVIALLFTPLKNRVEAGIEKLFVKKEFQRLKRELLEIDKGKALATLAAGLAHEIRNPLTAIKTFSEYLPKKYDTPNFREDFSRIVTTEVNKINSLIGQLIEFARPSPPVMEITDINKLLDYTLELLSADMIKSNIRLIKDYRSDNMVLSADSDKLKHALFNIIKNALEAMAPEGKLTVRTWKDEKLHIEISDTGSGIRKQDIQRIFEPFFSTKEKGSGLGLCVVESIIEEHGGLISVESTPSKGTSFLVSL